MVSVWRRILAFTRWSANTGFAVSQWRARHAGLPTCEMGAEYDARRQRVHGGRHPRVVVLREAPRLSS